MRSGNLTHAVRENLCAFAGRFRTAGRILSRTARNSVFSCTRSCCTAANPVGRWFPAFRRGWVSREGAGRNSRFRSATVPLSPVASAGPSCVRVVPARERPGSSRMLRRTAATSDVFSRTPDNGKNYSPDSRFPVQSRKFFAALSPYDVAMPLAPADAQQQQPHRRQRRQAGYGRHERPEERPRR